jgi:hypothetical protein
MPSRSELQGLYNAGITYDNWGPFENSGDCVWSSEVRDSSSAWYFNFDRGTEGWEYRDFGGDNEGFFGLAFAVRSR